MLNQVGVEGYGLVNQLLKVFRQFQTEFVLLQNPRNLHLQDRPHIGYPVLVPQNQADNRGLVAFLCQLDYELLHLVGIEADSFRDVLVVGLV